MRQPQRSPGHCNCRHRPTQKQEQPSLKPLLTQRPSRTPPAPTRLVSFQSPLCYPSVGGYRGISKSYSPTRGSGQVRASQIRRWIEEDNHGGVHTLGIRLLVLVHEQRRVGKQESLLVIYLKESVVVNRGFTWDGRSSAPNSTTRTGENGDTTGICSNLCLAFFPPISPPALRGRLSSGFDFSTTCGSLSFVYQRAWRHLGC